MKRPHASGAHFKSEVEVAANQSARDRVRNQRNTRKRHRVLHTVAVTAALCAGLAGTYGAGLVFFSSHYYPKTQVAGIDAAGMTSEALVREIDGHIGSLAVDVQGDAFEFTLPGSEVDLACDAATLADRLLAEQDERRWPIDVVARVFGPSEAMAATDSSAGEKAPRDTGITFSAKKLATRVDEEVEQFNKTARQPVSARLALSHQGNEFVLISETDGTALDAKAVRAAVEEALAQGKETVRLTADDLIQPTYRVDDTALAEARNRANALLGMAIPLLRDGQEVARISGETFARWLEVQDGVKLGIDAEAAATWADEHLWKAADFADKVAVHALDASSFGPALLETLQKMMSGAVNAEGLSPRELTVELPYVLTARYLPGDGTLNPTPWNPELGRYIDVDKSSQTACLYDSDGRVLWETIVTTGNETSGDGTPAGQFDIYDKATDFMLIGLDRDGDGQPDYERHVDYWMPFNGAIGLHDALWRDTYGGSEYQGHGSGGCVNLPHDAAAALFAMTHRGEMVVVHE